MNNYYFFTEKRNGEIEKVTVTNELSENAFNMRVWMENEKGKKVFFNVFHLAERFNGMIESFIMNDCCLSGYEESINETFIDLCSEIWHRRRCNKFVKSYVDEIKDYK